jgi:hypothetical protein
MLGTWNPRLLSLASDRGDGYVKAWFAWDPDRIPLV